MPEEDDVIISYPRTGKKELPVGKTIFDFVEGKVIFPDGEESLQNSIRKETPCRSMLIYTDAEIERGVYRNKTKEINYSSVFPGLYEFRNYPAFDTLRIKTTKATRFYITVSTAPDGIPVIGVAGVSTPTGGQPPLKFQDDVTGSPRSVTVITLKDPDDPTANYVVPEGYRMVIGLAIISADLPLWFAACLCVSPGTIGKYSFCGRGQVEFPIQAGTTVDAGVTPQIYIFNDSDFTVNFSTALNCIEEEI